MDGSDGARAEHCLLTVCSAPQRSAEWPSGCMAAGCGVYGRCRAPAYSARVLGASRRRAARGAWATRVAHHRLATSTAHTHGAHSRCPEGRPCAAGEACARQLTARGSKPDVPSQRLYALSVPLWGHRMCANLIGIATKSGLQTDLFYCTGRSLGSGGASDVQLQVEK